MQSLGRSVVSALLLALAVLVVGGVPLAGLPVARTAIVRADSPAPSADNGDTRSAGEGPGIVGTPALAILAVLGLGLLTAVLTTAYVRLSGGRRRTE